MSRVKAVLFDLDDTLFDHRHSSRTALTRFQERYESMSSVTLDELERVNLTLLNEIHWSVLDGTVSMEEARLKRFGLLFGRYSISLSQNELLEASNLYRVEYQRSRRATTGAIELLKDLRSSELRIGIVTNNMVDEQMDKLQQCGLAPLIDSLTISEEAGVAKPNPRIFQLALQRTGSQADEAVMIGDSWTSDVLGAIASGIRPIWFNCYSDPNPDERISEIFSFEDRLKVVGLIQG